MKKKDYLDDYVFFKEQFEKWWGGDDGLRDKLTRCNAFSDSTEVEFKLDGKNIIANIVCNTSDDAYQTDWDKHDKGEVLTDLVISSIKKYLKISDDEFDEEMIYLSLFYDEGFLSDVEFIYDDKEFIVGMMSEEEEINTEISNILSDWTVTFCGDGYESWSCYIHIDMYDENFTCTDIVRYSFEIESPE